MKQTPLKRKTGLKSNNPLRSKTFSSLKKSKSLKKTSNPEIQEADSKFSKIIIERDGKCLNCGSPYFLSCSHFYPRSNYATRWEPNNLITLCLPCHETWESKKKGIYEEFMREWLGENRFHGLYVISLMKIDKESALINAQEYIKLNYQDNQIEF